MSRSDPKPKFEMRHRNNLLVTFAALQGLSTFPGADILADESACCRRPDCAAPRLSGAAVGR